MTVGGTSTISGDGYTPVPAEMSVPAAWAGTLTTRTDNDTGVVTTTLAHDILTSDTVDLYDSSGELMRKDVDVTAVGANTISIDLGTGVSPYTNLPVLTTVINVAKQKILLLSFLDDKIKAWGRQLTVPGATTKGRFLFEDSGGDNILDEVLTAGVGLINNVAGGETNLLDNSGGGIAKVTVTQGNTLVAGTVQVLSIEDRTP
jgi:hypothetical protein